MIKINIRNGDYVLNTFLLVRKELLNEIDALSDKQLNMKPSEDKWSVSQVIRHLAFIDEAILRALRKAVQEESKRVTEKNLDSALDRTNKIKSRLPEPSTEFTNKEDLWKILNQARTPLLEYINEIIDGTVIEDKSMIHPVFGPISIKQMIESIGLHEKRHIEQIKEIKESILNC
ncbi:PadR family transcriptional regulator [Salipaludibacillus neizhouensis]|uniref:PadR family transcriptional regulator n=1 Tax=Salipaludibacillus neizhouensis TaxID=885475 RepID=A0A3A9K0G2_9BACI|nr:DinB family protein [Salipaludibacillus neizhouensis]RKL65869.1 PadR family transcriptional regulator [Salipaludibacillus neizhouensis]